MPANDIFISGTDTNIGKTVLAATLCAALDLSYWKPIQSGTLHDSDRAAVRRYADIPESQTFPSTYEFEPAVSPHLAARLAGKRIKLDSIRRPQTDAPLVIEGAGGVLVPLNEHDLMIDLMRHLDSPVILAARTALGTINHTLLSIQALRSEGLELKGVVMIGKDNEENCRAIEHYGDTPVIVPIPQRATINRQVLLDVFKQYFRPPFFP